MVQRLSKIAAQGTRPSNAERDLQTILQKAVLQVVPEEVHARMWNPKTNTIVRAKVPVLMPDALASAIWKHDPEVFRWLFMADMSAADCRAFWDHTYASSEWFRAHPSSAGDRSGLIPLTLYGDEVCTYKNSEIGNVMVLAWCSDFGHSRPPITRYLLLACYAEHQASVYTYKDLMLEVCKRVTHMVDDAVRHPWSPHYRFMFSSNQGDLKFFKDNHFIHPSNQNRFCSWCECMKDDPDGRPGMTLADFRETALHKSTRITHEEYMRRTTPDTSLLERSVSLIPWSSQDL